MNTPETDRAKLLAHNQGRLDAMSRGNTATLVGRFVVDATVYGSRCRWRLELAQTCTQLAGHWISTA